METTEVVMGKRARRQEVDDTGPPGPPVLPARVGLNVSRPVCPGLAV